MVNLQTSKDIPKPVSEEGKQAMGMVIRDRTILLHMGGDKVTGNIAIVTHSRVCIDELIIIQGRIAA